MFFKEAIVISSFMYCLWQNTPTYIPTYAFVFALVLGHLVDQGLVYLVLYIASG